MDVLGTLIEQGHLTDLFFPFSTGHKAAVTEDYVEGLGEVVRTVVRVGNLSLDKETTINSLSNTIKQQLFLLIDTVTNSSSSSIHHQGESVKGCRPSWSNRDQVSKRKVIQGAVWILMNRISPINRINLVICQHESKAPSSDPVSSSHSSVPIKRILIHVDDFSGVAASFKIVIELEGGGELDFTVLWDKEGLVGVEETGFTGLGL